MGNELRPDAKKNKGDLFRITYFAGDGSARSCTFNISGPNLSRKRFAAVHEYLEDALEALNAGLAQQDDDGFYRKLDPPKPGAVENTE